MHLREFLSFIFAIKRLTQDLRIITYDFFSILNTLKSPNNDLLYFSISFTFLFTCPSFFFNSRVRLSKLKRSKFRERNRDEINIPVREA